MLQLGKNIRQAGDPLTKIAPEQLFRLIQRPSAELEAMIEQLRTVQSIDLQRYRALKAMLPYFTSSVFNPPVRRGEHFAYTSYLVLDIDHLNDTAHTEALRTRLSADARVMLCFVSPGGQGLKALFRLSERCDDSGRYSLFYKTFALAFATDHGLQAHIDTRTSDVARACFLSADSGASFRPEPVPIEMSSLVNFDNEVELLDLRASLREHEASLPLPEIPSEKAQPADEVLLEIRQRLNPNARKAPREKIIYVPGELDPVVDDIRSRLTTLNIELREVRNIHYGKKIVAGVGYRWAEVNVFYGQRGFSVVKSPKGGSNAELGELLYEIVSDMLLGSVS